MYQKFKKWALQKFNLKETTYNNYISKIAIKLTNIIGSFNKYGYKVAGLE